MEDVRGHILGGEIFAQDGVPVARLLAARPPAGRHRGQTVRFSRSENLRHLDSLGLEHHDASHENHRDA